jgi:S1-C subfamily serine protease
VTIGLTVAVLMAAACRSTPWSEPTRDDIIRRILPAVVQVVVEQQEGRRLRTGSGVAVAARNAARGRECFVLTSGHTVTDIDGRRQVHIVLDRHLGDGAGKKATAVVLARRETAEIDLAILRAETERCSAPPLAAPPSLGASVWVVGFPWGRHLTLSSGVISQLNFAPAVDAEAAARLMIDAPVSYGSSGGGVFDARTGGLIGLVEGYRTARLTSPGAAPDWYIDVPVPGQTIVTPLTDIRRFLTDVGYAGLLASGDRWGR